MKLISSIWKRTLRKPRILANHKSNKVLLTNKQKTSYLWNVKTFPVEFSPITILTTRSSAKNQIYSTLPWRAYLEKEIQGMKTKATG